MGEPTEIVKLMKSPLRYPGGKGAFYSYFSALIEKNNLSGGKYFEPFAGGAGVALGLLSSGKVSQIILNDADYHIYSFWRAILTENKLFIKKIQETKVTIKEWKIQKDIYNNHRKHPIFDVGFSTFFLNRCNRSGILNAGPIGGYKQKGIWKINERFNKKTLIERISRIGTISNSISVKNMDGVSFMKKFIPYGNERKKVFVYLDPPYVSAGDDLYLNRFTKNEHAKLAAYLHKQILLNWVLTYDNSLLIKQLYDTCHKILFYLNYSLQAKRRGKELLISSEKLTLPRKNSFSCDKWEIIKKVRSINEK